MTLMIRPLQVADLDALSRFLTAGFHTAADADFATPAVLQWKYLEPQQELCDAPHSFLSCDLTGAIVGHVGICRTAFEGEAIPQRRVDTLHMIDWLGSNEHRAVGASLMRKAHELAPTQFGLGGSKAGRTLIKRGGYVLQNPVDVYQYVAHPTYWLRLPGLGMGSRGLRLARDLFWNARHVARSAPHLLEIRRVEAFGAEVEPVAAAAQRHAILTSRTQSRLNHVLRFPLQAVSGWHLFAPPDRLCGFAILNLVPQHGGRVRVGKLVDCVLASTEVEIWYAAILALRDELVRQGADILQALAGTPWVAQSLARAGFTTRYSLEFSLRDRQELLPRDVPFYLTLLEADYFYT
jgi:hypothetical protein